MEAKDSNEIRELVKNHTERFFQDKCMDKMPTAGEQKYLLKQIAAELYRRAAGISKEKWGSLMDQTTVEKLFQDAAELDKMNDLTAMEAALLHFFDELMENLDSLPKSCPGGAVLRLSAGDRDHIRQCLTHLWTTAREKVKHSSLPAVLMTEEDIKKKLLDLEQLVPERLRELRKEILPREIKNHVKSVFTDDNTKDSPAYDKAQRAVELIWEEFKRRAYVEK